jgi:hypothetical protein
MALSEEGKRKATSEEKAGKDEMNGDMIGDMKIVFKGDLNGDSTLMVTRRRHALEDEPLSN